MQNAPENRACVVPGCPSSGKRRQPFCAEHWFSIPATLKARLGIANRAKRRGDAAAAREYDKAMDCALAIARRVEQVELSELDPPHGEGLAPE